MTVIYVDKNIARKTLVMIPNILSEVTDTGSFTIYIIIYISQ